MSESNTNRRLFAGVFSPNKTDLYSLNPEIPQLIILPGQALERRSPEERGRRSLGNLGIRVSSERILRAHQPTGDEGYLFRLVATRGDVAVLTPFSRDVVDAYTASLAEDDPERYFLSQTLAHMRATAGRQNTDTLL